MRRALAAVAALSVLALAACTGTSPGNAFSEADAQPTWSVECSMGSTPIEGLGDLRLDCLGGDVRAKIGTDGKPLVLVLWASWCIPCQDEAPEVEAFYQAYGDQVDVLGVDTADTLDAGRWFAQDFEMTFPSVQDPDEAVRIGLGVPALPGIALVNPDGTIAELVLQPGVTTESLTATAESAFGLELA